MKTNSLYRFVVLQPRLLIGVALCLALSSAISAEPQQAPKSSMQVTHSYKNDVSPALRDLPALWPPKFKGEKEEAHEANLNPPVELFGHVDAPDPIIDKGILGVVAPNAMPPVILNFDGIPFPGVGCNCAPPDTVGAIGATQYVQMVNEGVQVFNKTTGASVLGPISIGSIWAGFGQPCESQGVGDPIALYDRIANRWLISQFAGGGITDQCIAISTSPDATGTYNRYGFHLGPNAYDYPHLGVWMDGYYQTDNVFNSALTAFLGRQAFAFDKAKMIAGLPATMVSPGLTASNENQFLPADFDGTYFPPSGTGAPFVSFPNNGTYKVWLFKVDFVTPENSTFTLIGNPAAAPFTAPCPGTRNCVPQLGAPASLDHISDRLMHRVAYRKFADGTESVVSNYTVLANGVTAPRWFELRNVTTAPTVFQESTYQPSDTTWRWMGSAAQDAQGNLMLGFSASDATINPQIRYAGRLATDPINTLAQGEAHMFDGTGSQVGNNRWGDYSAMSIDPVDDCTFWYTQEYYATNAAFGWRTRIGNFKFPQCVSTPHAAIISTSSSLTAESCLPANNVLDPYETVTVSFCIQNAGSAPAGNLVGTLQDTGGVSGGTAQTYGAVATGAASCQSFTFVPTGNCGDTITATIRLQDGATDLGEVSYTFVMGTQITTPVASEAFDSVTAPALPTGWTSAATGLETAWVTSTTNPTSAPNDAFAPDVSGVGVSELVSPAIAVPSGDGFQLRFRNLYNMENGFDGMVLEISVNGGAFTDIVAAGGTFTTGGYNGTISTAFQSPIGGRMAWTGRSAGTGAAPLYITTKVQLPSSAIGQSIQLKWVAATDFSGVATGQPGVRIDDMAIAANYYVCCLSVTPTPTPTPSPTPSASPTPSPTPTPIPAAQALNLSTRLLVQGGDSVGVAGFIIAGSESKQILIRGLGPSLGTAGVPNALANPALVLNGDGGFVTLTNNNWRDTQEQAIIDTGIPPSEDLESAIVVTLPPGLYTAIIKGEDGGSGAALVELYDLSENSASKLGNISTRAFVGTGSDIVIAGFILGNNTGNDKIVVRGIGPSLGDFGVANPLADPMLELRNANGSPVGGNDNWNDFPPAGQELQMLGLAPTNSLESAIVKTLAPGSYTALLSGVGGTTGVGLIEVYDNPGQGPTPAPTGTPGPTPTPGGETPTPAPTPTPGQTPTPGPTGTPGVCTENFDGVTAPALPAGWVASNPVVGDGVMFVTTTTSSDSAPNNAFIPDQDDISDKVLDRQVTINSASPVMTFRNNFDSEFTDGIYWDGGVVEISAPNISGGEFLDVTDSHVGGSITSGGYTGEISGDASSPLAGRFAWSGNSGGYINTVINLGPNLNGQTITVRFRFATDEAIAFPGWHIDGLSITGASCQ